MKKLILVLLLASMVMMSLSACGTDSQPTQSASPPASAPVSPPPEPPPASPPAEAPPPAPDEPKPGPDPQDGLPVEKPFDEAVIYQSGMHKVGADIPAGIYLVIADDSILSSLTVKDGSGSDANVLTIDAFTEHSIIGVEEGQYLEVRGASFVGIEYTKALFGIMYDEYGFYCEGMYLAGFMIPAGEYKLTPDADAMLSSYTIYSDATQQKVKDIGIIGDSGSYVTLKSGEYISVRGATFVPA